MVFWLLIPTVWFIFYLERIYRIQLESKLAYTVNLTSSYTQDGCFTYFYFPLLHEGQFKCNWFMSIQNIHEEFNLCISAKSLIFVYPQKVLFLHLETSLFTSMRKCATVFIRIKNPLLTTGTWRLFRNVLIFFSILS